MASRASSCWPVGCALIRAGRTWEPHGQGLVQLRTSPGGSRLGRWSRAVVGVEQPPAVRPGQLGADVGVGHGPAARRAPALTRRSPVTAPRPSWCRRRPWPGADPTAARGSAPCTPGSRARAAGARRSGRRTGGAGPAGRTGTLHPVGSVVLAASSRRNAAYSSAWSLPGLVQHHPASSSRSSSGRPERNTPSRCRGGRQSARSAWTSMYHCTIATLSQDRCCPRCWYQSRTQRSRFRHFHRDHSTGVVWKSSSSSSSCRRNSGASSWGPRTGRTPGGRGCAAGGARAGRGTAQGSGRTRRGRTVGLRPSRPPRPTWSS